MGLDKVLRNFLSLTQDAVAVGYRARGESDARLVYVNQGFVDLLGYDPEEVMHQPVSFIHDPEDWPEFLARIAPNIEAGTPRFQSEAVIKCADGTPFWSSLALILGEHDLDGGRYSIATYRDINELVRQRRAAEQARHTAEQAQERLLSTISAYPDPFVIYDKDWRLVACNTAYEDSMSNKPGAVRKGMHFVELLTHAVESGLVMAPPEGIGPYFEEIYRSLESSDPSVDLKLPGDVHHRAIRSVAKNGDILALRMDITELVRQRRSAEEAQSRLLSAINAYPAPFCIYDADFKLLVYNKQYAEGFTNDPSELSVGMSLEQAVRVGLDNGAFADAVGREEAWLAEFLANAVADHPLEDLHLAGDRFHRVFRSRSDGGDLIMVGVDMTEQVRQRRALEEYAARLEDANAEIVFKALHDELTGLGNRRYLIEKFEALRRRYVAEGGELAALHLDLDRFKQINDTIGHGAGDNVLKIVAERIRMHVRPDDVVARIGGDEFVILIWEPAPTDRPFQLARTLVDAMSKPASFEGRECRFGASAGIARTPLADVGELLTSSDVALYKAKRAGRGVVGIFDGEDIKEMQQTKAMADDIMRGLELSEFHPFYQPQIDARSGQIVGVEALARWEHPEKGILMPDVFLPVAEDLNVVSEIDRQIFDKAIAACKAIFAGFDPIPNLSFNVSARRVSDGDFDDIAQRVSDYPGEVAFELLETIFLEEQDDGFLFQLDKLRDLGISIEVDDFGSGRASIVSLQRIAPDRLKIDRRLVAPIAEGNSAARLVKSIIEIGNALSIAVVAEGVETAEHARILTDLGADCLQGFHFSEPLNAAGLRDYFHAHTRQVDRPRKRGNHLH